MTSSWCKGLKRELTVSQSAAWRGRFGSRRDGVSHDRKSSSIKSRTMKLIVGFLSGETFRERQRHQIGKESGTKLPMAH